jgi:membrane-associated phospholipid phosphatase
VLVGAARVAAHIHRPIDSVGSFVFAGIAVFVTQVLRGKWRKGRRAGPIR